MSERMALHIYETQRAGLISYATRLLGERSRAEDVVQDAWIDFQRVPDMGAIHNPAAYLQRIVRNHALNLLRRDQRTRRLMEADTNGLDAADPAPSPESAAIARQRLSRFMHRLAQLPERQRLAIRLHRLEGLKMREIADQLGVSVPFVHALIAEGLAKCAEAEENGEA